MVRLTLLTIGVVLVDSSLLVAVVLQCLIELLHRIAIARCCGVKRNRCKTISSSSLRCPNHRTRVHPRVISVRSSENLSKVHRRFTVEVTQQQEASRRPKCKLALLVAMSHNCNCKPCHTVCNKRIAAGPALLPHSITNAAVYEDGNTGYSLPCQMHTTDV